MYGIHELKELNMAVEGLGEALLCGDVVCLQERKEYTISDSCGQAWGEYIEVKAKLWETDDGIEEGCYIRVGKSKKLEYVEKDLCCCIDDIGACLDVIRIRKENPLRISFTKHVGVRELCYGEVAEEYQPHTRAELIWHPEDEGVVVDGCCGLLHNILIPPEIEGRPVLCVELDEMEMQSCVALIVSEGVKQLQVDFQEARLLERLQISDEVQLVNPPDEISRTPWFLRQPPAPVYLCGYYCGTPDGGIALRDLVVRDGTVGVAAGADFRHYWRSVYLPDSILEIGEGAFSYGVCLEEVRLPTKLHKLGDHSFQYCERLPRLSLPKTLRRPVNSFQCCRALQEVSMHDDCWDSCMSYFFDCPLFLLYHDQGVSVITRDRTPKPVIGKLRAFPKGVPFQVWGKTYERLQDLTVRRVGYGNDYLDCCGRPVRHVRVSDPQLISNSHSGIYWKEFWFIPNEAGVALIEPLDYDAGILVHEDIRLEDVDQLVQSRVKDLFAERQDEQQ